MGEVTDQPTVERRKSLDELFANEPFLSPTMKAKRLFEKMQEEDGDRMAPGAVVSEAIPTSTGYSVLPDRLEPQTPNPGATLMSMTAARAILGEQSREGGPAMPGEPASLSMLRALQDRMLNPWLRNIKGDF